MIFKIPFLAGYKRYINPSADAIIAVCAWIEKSGLIPFALPKPKED